MRLRKHTRSETHLNLTTSTFSDRGKVMEQLREQVMINQFVQVFKRVFITANNRKRRHPEKVLMLSVPGHFAKQSDVQHISFQMLFHCF